MSTIGALAIGFRAAREAKVSSRRTARSFAGARVGLARLYGALGTIAGLAAITAAAWTVALPLGLLVGGLAAFVLEWRLAE